LLHLDNFLKVTDDWKGVAKE
jgi:hypothetical protein